MPAAWTPQGLFPRKSLIGGGTVPANVLLGIVAQESNMSQASWHVVPGDDGEPSVDEWAAAAGTNNYEGSLYHYYRNDKLNANTWFNNREGVEKAKLLAAHLMELPRRRWSYRFLFAPGTIGSLAWLSQNPDRLHLEVVEGGALVPDAHATQDAELVGVPRQPRHQVAELHPGHVRLALPQLAAERRRRLLANARYARAHGFEGMVCPPGLVMLVGFSQTVEDVSENARANLEYIDMRFGVPV